MAESSAHTIPPSLTIAVSDASASPTPPHTPARPATVPGPETPLTPRDPMIVLGYRCLRRELGVLVERQPARGAAPSTHDVHQLRIATRRLRVALRLFAHMLPKQATAKVTRELRWFARALGEVRDLDVYADALRDYARSVAADDAQELGGYELHVRRDRTVARTDLAELFGSERYAEILAALTALVDGAPSTGALRRWRSFKISDGAKCLKRSRKRVLKLGRKIGHDAHAKDLHRLRIRAKRLRYELEFFLEAYPALADPAKATKALQDVLGAHQDACTATAALNRYARTLRARGQDGSIAPAALGQWRTNQRQKAAEARGTLPAKWEHFVATLAGMTLDAD